MIRGIDHVAITVSDLDATCRFYADVLGATVEEAYEIGGRIAVKRVAFGKAILNIHQQGNGVDLVARLPTPGSTDICFRWDGNAEEARTMLEARGVELVEGPVPRVSADGRAGSSVYFRDPDGNLVELLAAD
jgi:catechol 2,3-dioxygenase-like lactoylglutathione lyase family enzyme